MTASVSTFMQPVLGFRAWKLTPDGDLLPRAVSALEHLDAGPWRRGRNDALCMYAGITRTAHAAPDADCDCGLYAYHEVASVRREWQAQDCVVGAIVGWGNLQVHRTGFRAERAQVVALASPASPNLTIPARLAAAHHGVPLVSFDELRPRAAVHGAALPIAVRPSGGKPFATWWATVVQEARAGRSERAAASDGDHATQRGTSR